MRTTILAFAAVALLGSALACPRPPAPAGKTTPVEKPAPAPADPAPDTAPAITAGVPMKPDGTVDKEALKQFTHLEALKQRSWDGREFAWGEAIPADPAMLQTPPIDTEFPIPDVEIQPAARKLAPPEPDQGAQEKAEAKREATESTAAARARGSAPAGGAKEAGTQPAVPQDPEAQVAIPAGPHGVQTREFTYQAEGITLTGYGAVPEGVQNPPVVVMVHGMVPPGRYGLNDMRREAEYLAARGIAALVPDMRGYRKTPAEANAELNRLAGIRDVANLIQAIRINPGVGLDGTRVGVYGFGHGGAVALKVSFLVPVAGTFVVSTTGLQEALDQDLFKKTMAPAVATAMEQLYGPPSAETASWYKAMTISNFLDRFQAPIGFAGGQLDPIVPKDWPGAFMQILAKTTLQSQMAMSPYAGHTYHGQDWLGLMQTAYDFFRQRFNMPA